MALPSCRLELWKQSGGGGRNLCCVVDPIRETQHCRRVYLFRMDPLQRHCLLHGRISASSRSRWSVQAHVGRRLGVQLGCWWQREGLSVI